MPHALPNVSSSFTRKKRAVGDCLSIFSGKPKIFFDFFFHTSTSNLVQCLIIVFLSVYGGTVSIHQFSRFGKSKIDLHLGNL